MHQNLQESDNALLEKAREVSLAIIQKNVSAKGLAASVDNYPQIWARDTVVTFLGATVDGDVQMLEAFRASLEILEKAQDRFGQIPNLINLKTDEIGYGSCDSTIWWVLGCCLFAQGAERPDWLSQRACAMIRALDWCEMRDFTKVGLICSLEADDWADHICHRGHVLFANALLVWALNLASDLLAESHAKESAHWRARSQLAVQQLQENHWVNPLHSFEDHSHHQLRAQISIRLRELPYFLPWINKADFGERFDSAGNLMAILAGVAQPEQANAILGFIRNEGLDQPYPVRANHPVMLPGDRDWREYYMVWGHGLPYHYANGGIWPWVGGLYVAALVHAGQMDRAQEQLISLARALKIGKSGQWECNEWLHGQTGHAMGAKFQAWSAGMFLYAHHCVRTGRAPGFVTGNLSRRPQANHVD